MTDWTQLILPAAGTILSGTTLAAIFTYLLARSKAPVERESAHSAASAELAEAAASLVEPLSNEVKRLDIRVQRAETAASEAHDKAIKTDREVAGLRTLTTEADDYIRDLHVRWETHRLKQRPPFWRWLSDEGR